MLEQILCDIKGVYGPGVLDVLAKKFLPTFGELAEPEHTPKICIAALLLVMPKISHPSLPALPNSLALRVQDDTI